MNNISRRINDLCIQTALNPSLMMGRDSQTIVTVIALVMINGREVYDDAPL